MSKSTVALVIWGNTFECFFDNLNISIEQFADNFVGSWQFGYVNALKTARFETILFYVSARVDRVVRVKHKPTGAEVCFLPATKTFKIVNKFIKIPVFKPLADYLSTPIHIFQQELIHYNCKAIICQEYEYARFDICTYLGKKLNIPVLGVFQGGNKTFSNIEKPIRRWSIANCGGLIIADRAEAMRVQNKYKLSPDRIHQIPNPLNSFDWQIMPKERARAQLNLDAKSIIVIWHGRLQIQQKGLDILIKAWQILEKDLTEPIKLILIGTGTDVSLLQELISKNQLQHVIHIDKFIAEPELIAKYLSAADIYVFPSRHEGFPVAPIEAMASRLPLIAATAPGIPDIFSYAGNNSIGIQVPVDCPFELAEALKTAISNSEWREAAGTNARQTVLENFSLQQVGAKLKTLLTEIESVKRV